MKTPKENPLALSPKTGILPKKRRANWRTANWKTIAMAR